MLSAFQLPLETHKCHLGTLLRVICAPELRLHWPCLPTPEGTWGEGNTGASVGTSQQMAAALAALLLGAEDPVKVWDEGEGLHLQ